MKLVCAFFVGLFPLLSVAQLESAVPTEKEVSHTVDGWLGTYTKYRFTEKLYYYGEYHYRRRNYFRDMGQVYLRFGATYLINKNLEVTGGVVTPFYWAPRQIQEQHSGNIDMVVPQFRFWQQVLFVQPFSRAKVYHQIRLEQRWRRSHVIDSPFDLTWRFRYKIMTYIPLNKPNLVNGTLFLSAYEEIFIQTGKTIIFDHMEDNRMFIGLGYILNENIQIQAGYMWTYRHAGAPNKYEHRHIPRFSIYHNMDFYRARVEKKRREQQRIILNNEF